VVELPFLLSVATTPRCRGESATASQALVALDALTIGPTQEEALSDDPSGSRIGFSGLTLRIWALDDIHAP
jgi:hypothetical protein